MDHYSIVEPPSPDPDKERAGSSVQPDEPLAPPEIALPPATILGIEGENAAEQQPAVLPAAAEPPPQRAEPERSGNDLDAGLQAVIQKAQYVCNATGAAIALRQGSDVVCRAASGNGAPDRGARLQVKTGLTAECLRTGELLRCDNVMQDTRVDLESCTRLGIESIIITPIRRGQTLVGVLELFCAHAYSFQERDVETVKALAEEIGKMLDGAEAPLQPAVTEASLQPEIAEPPVVRPPAAGMSTCGTCGAQIESDAVFCTACGGFQESKPAASEPAPDWRARLNSRRMLVPAVFVVMALVVAVAPIPHRNAAVAPGAKPVLQAAARPASAPAASAPAAAKSTVPASAPLASKADNTNPVAGAPNPTIAKSVKQLLGGVSSDFSKLLPVNEKAEPPSNGDPNLKVWVDTRKGYYYCPGDEQYGHTQHGSFMTQKEAEANYYIPALIKPCM